MDGGYHTTLPLPRKEQVESLRGEMEQAGKVVKEIRKVENGYIILWRYQDAN